MSEHGEILGYLVELSDLEWRELQDQVKRLRQATVAERARARERLSISALEREFEKNGVVLAGLRRGLHQAPDGTRYLCSSWPKGYAKHLIVHDRGKLWAACGDLPPLSSLVKLDLVEIEDACRRCTRFKPNRGDVRYSIKASALAAKSIARRS